MRDLIPLAVLALLLTGVTTVLVGVSCAVIACGRWLSRLLIPRPRTAPTAPVIPAQRRPHVWLACDTPRCGHLQTPHYPAGPGLLQCDGCGLFRPIP